MEIIRKISRILLLTIVSAPCYAMENMDESSKAAQGLIHYIRESAKTYERGPTLAKLEGQEPFSLYMDLANSMSQTSPETPLQLWGDLAGVFVEIVENNIKYALQKEELVFFKREWEQRTTSNQCDKIWFDLFMLRLSILMTPPAYRNDTLGAITNYDQYMVALKNHIYQGKPAWLSHKGMVNACETIGTEATRRFYSPLAQSRLYGVWILPYPYELNSKELIQSLPEPNSSRLWLAGFNVAPTGADGEKSLSSFLFYGHDLQHLAIYFWFLSGGESAFFKNLTHGIPSEEEYWNTVRLGRKAWYTSLAKIKQLVEPINPKSMSEEEQMTLFFAFNAYHERRDSLFKRLAEFWSDNDRGLSTGDNYSTFLNENFYKPLLPPSLQKIVTNKEQFFKIMSVYEQDYNKKLEEIVLVINKENPELAFPFGYNIELLKKYNLKYIAAEHWLFDTDPKLTRFEDNQSIQLLNMYGNEKKLYKKLQEKKKKNPTTLMALYQYETSLFTMDEKAPFCQRDLFDLGSDSPQQGNAHILDSQALRYWKTNTIEGCQFALQFYTLAHNKGYFEAGNNLGCLYGFNFGQFDKGITRDKEKAIDLLKEAIKRGSHTALKNLEQIYGDNLSFEDQETLIQLLEKAAEQGNIHAAKSLGMIYQFMQRNYERAVPYYSLVIKEIEDAECLNNLGFMYCIGQGVEKNTTQGIKLLERSVAQNNPRAMSNLAAFLVKSGEIDNQFERIATLYKRAIQGGIDDFLVDLRKSALVFKNEQMQKLYEEVLYS